MNRGKRTIALLLSLVMCLSLMDLTAFAEDTPSEEIADAVTQEAICEEETAEDASAGIAFISEMPEERVLLATATHSGTCGDHLTWTLDSDGVLTISGTGSMKNFSGTNYIPWYDYRSDITSIVIKDGATSIGQYAFRDCSSLTSVTIPDSVTSIGYYAFYNCTNLTSITIPDSVTSIGEYAFYYCSSLTDVYYSGTETGWNAISISGGNECLTGATIHYNHIHSSIKDTIVEATCTTSGYTEHLCVYGETYTDTYVAALGHLSSNQIVVAPTCTIDGYTEYTCSRCGETIRTTVAATGHTYGDEGIVTPPTCIAKGYTTYQCVVCGETCQDDFTATVSHTMIVDEEVAATCTTEGKTIGTHCSVCGYIGVAQETVAALGHTWDEGEVTKAATETETGVRT